MFSRRDKFMLFLLQLHDKKLFDTDLTTKIYLTKQIYKSEKNASTQGAH